MSATFPPRKTSADYCANHDTCLRNQRTYFRLPQTCLVCERAMAAHFLYGVHAIAPRCDECLLSRQGCPHAAPNICPECFDWIGITIRETGERRLARIAEIIEAVKDRRTEMLLDEMNEIYKLAKGE